MSKFYGLFTAFVCFGFAAFSQNSDKISLTHSVYDSWNDLKASEISANGQWIAYEINPQRGDGTLWLVNEQENLKKPFERGHKATISPENNFLVFMVSPKFADTRKAKLDKKKSDKMPKDSLGIYLFDSKAEKYVTKVKSYKIAEKTGNWIAILREQPKPEMSKDSLAKTKKKTVKRRKESTKVGQLLITNPVENATFTYDSVTDYAISENGSTIAFITSNSKDSLNGSDLYVFDTKTKNTEEIFKNTGEAKSISIDGSGSQLAFLFTADTGKVRIFDLYYWNSKSRSVEKIVGDKTSGMPSGYVVSKHKEPYFSENGQRLFFFTIPKPVEEPKDTLTDDEKVVLDVWSWTDTLLQTQQKAHLKDIQEQSFMAVVHLKDKKMVQLESKLLPDIYIPQKNNGDFGIGNDDSKYEYSMTWDYPWKKDYYLVDVNGGNRTLIATGLDANVIISPSGNYVAYYNTADSAWYTWSRKTEKSTCLTKNLSVNFYYESNDMPQVAWSYGFGGWIEGEKSFLVYDKFDIWALDPQGKTTPICITGQNGRKTNITYRVIKTDKDDDYINTKEKLLLSVFNHKNKQNGFASVNFLKGNSPTNLLVSDHLYRFLGKAKNADNYIWTRQSYKEYGDLWHSNANFSDPIKVSEANPQIPKYKWGSVELVKWIDFNRDSVEGLLYKPKNFDPNKKYPMMVYFYETHSDELNVHYSPKPGRSVICPTFYVSNDYLVFMPDIKYQIGCPGKSAYNAVVSGTMALIDKGFVDKDRIGVQGQSWGGYQIAYLVTQTNLFKAASAGAPVSNMTSAYGGIRWQSGLSRMFQYEHTQSRIGGTLWERPLNYIENSPLFYAPNVNTPLLIRHDDADGAVPWYQGIEYFLALRRLGKPVWLINYNDEPHNLARWANRVDWAIRMQQFFDYYLKDAPKPKWLDGIPAKDKGKTLGY
ncbi:MAG TPA: prolyl oligopeptidase family serine peptidase [Tenuifilaceae bacterium]|nr:prolyl oligopeptidase family serine peptidase [Tenuifilaceae bacterium]